MIEVKIPNTSFLFTITILWANPADDKLTIYFPEKGFDISCKLYNLHEMSKTIFWKKYEKIFQNVVCLRLPSMQC